MIAIGLLAISLAGHAHADCVISAASLTVDPVEAGFCESDAVFVGTVDARVETVRAYREEGSQRTQHHLIETSTVRITRSYKGKLPNKVEMFMNLYDKKVPAYSFERDKEYLVFAKQRAGERQYAGAVATCSVQSTLPIAESQKAIEQLEKHRKARRSIDCGNIRSKAVVDATSDGG